MAGPPLVAPAITAAEIAALTGGTMTGDGARRVCGVAPLDRAGPDELTFLADKRYADHLSACRAGVVLLAPEFASAPAAVGARVVVAKPYDALVALLPRFHRAPERPLGVHPTAQIGRGATIAPTASVDAYAVVGARATVGDRAWIGPHCVVGDGVTIGCDTWLVANVTCYAGTTLGDRVTIHAGARIGSDGFGYAFSDGAHRKIMHVGRCIIHDDVEIGANTCIDRGSVDDTVVGAGTKIDNLVHIAHNVHIGRLCLLMAQVGIAGSAHVEDGALLAGQAGIAGHATIGAGARVGAQAGAFGDVPPGETWSGYPARPHRESLKATAALFRLSALMKRIERLLDGGD
ncbi:MAG TPA: UDP-3-O-(3-hydroxymyristoyl)glucosamine N-acyltransferase [Gemmatimonadaceae bacterium]|nr:UDP-3-O-(3-hydroxymyristoyl)glucosamine N-acyltransferase [Gemmatimonadaceae bacterium]